MQTVSVLTVDLLSAGVREQHAHHLLEVAAGLGRVAVLTHVVQHSLEDVVQGRSGLVQQDAGPRQEAVQVPVGSDLLLKVHQRHILQKRKTWKMCLTSNISRIRLHNLYDV